MAAALRAKPKDDFFVHYLTTSFGADLKTISGLLQPNSTLLLDIQLQVQGLNSRILGRVYAV